MNAGYTRDDGRDDRKPVEFAVLSGEPTAEELAAVTAVIVAAAAKETDRIDGERTAVQNGWPLQRAALRSPLEHGGRAWTNASWG